MDSSKRRIRHKNPKFALAFNRSSFIVNYIVTLLVVALILVVSLAPSSAQNSVPFPAAGNQATRTLFTPDVSTVDPDSKQQSETIAGAAKSSEEHQTSGSVGPSNHEPVESVEEQRPLTEKPARDEVPLGRQTRATTRKHATTTSTTSSSTDRETSSASSPQTTSVGGVTSPMSTTTAEDDDHLDRASKERKKRKKVADEEDHTEAAEEETEDDSEHSANGQHNAHLSKHLSSTTSTTPVSSTEVSPSTAEALSTTTVHSPKKTTRRRKIGNSTSTEASISSSTKKSRVDHDEHRINLDNIKTVGLDKWNETLASAPTTQQPESTTSTPPSSTVKTRQDSSSASHSNTTLDARSPTAQSPSLTKRLTGLISESKNKLLKHQQNRSTPADSRFGYSKPSSTSNPLLLTTPMPTKLATPSATDEPIYVQIVNQTGATKIVSSNETSDLDWSKLVKVVFKSSKDNHTIYTVVMNSSELNSHPISDWSNELPKLLQRDFEKLVQKWSNVFPIDHLMTDLGKIITNKVTNKANQTTPILNNLNGTLVHISSSNLENDSTGSDSAAHSVPHKNLKPILDGPSLSTNTSARLSSSSLPGRNKNITLTSLGDDQLLNSTSDSTNKSGIASWSSRLKPSLLNYTANLERNSTQANPTTIQGPYGNSGPVQGNKTGQFQAKPHPNRTIDELFQDLSDQHEVIDKGVKDQSSALKNFIVAALIIMATVLTLIIYMMLRLRS